MSEGYSIVHLLVNEVDRSKAVIKYETRQLQVQLKRITEAWDRSAFQYVAETIAQRDKILLPSDPCSHQSNGISCKAGKLFPAAEKPPVMWLDAIFQSAVKSRRSNAVKQIIASRKKDMPQTTSVRIEQLFNLIASEQEIVFFDKNVEDD